MRGGAITDAEIASGKLVDGSYICGSELVRIDDLKANYTIVVPNVSAPDAGIKGLYKANGNYYLIKQDKVPARTDPSGTIVPPIFVKKNP